MKKGILLILFMSTFQLLVAQFKETLVYLEHKPWGPILWESKIPESCPIEISKDLVAVEFTGKHADYTYADTWYPSWASDDNMYSPYTDGVSGVWGLSRSNKGKAAVTGQAKIVGDDPMELEVVSLGTYPGSAAPYIGRYPCGTLVYDSIWYYGTYCLKNDPPGYNLGTLGPFVGFRISKDYGETWIDCPYSCSNPLFGESCENGETVKLGSPHFVDFGKNMEHSPDGKAYLVGHGSVPEDPEPRPANASWISGDQIYLTRVTPSVENINDKSKYEYFCGRDVQGEPVWSDDFNKMQPIFEWNNKCGCVTMTYNSRLKKYIMCITDGWPTLKFMDTYFLESDNIEGPWKIVTYMEKFGQQGYFVNIPTKFISEDGYKSWLSYSGNFAPFTDLGVNPPGGRYAFILQEFRFLNKEMYQSYPKEANKRELAKRLRIWEETNPLTSGSNLALKAKVTVSSTGSGYSSAAAIDGIVAGFPNSPGNEWASDNETVGAKVRLTWNEEISVGKIWLFDRPSHNEHIKGASIVLSDGSSFEIGELPNSEYAAKEVTFEEKEIRWLELTVTKVGRAKNIGLAEIAVFE